MLRAFLLLVGVGLIALLLYAVERVFARARPNPFDTWESPPPRKDPPRKDRFVVDPSGPNRFCTVPGCRIRRSHSHMNDFLRRIKGQ